MSCFFFFFCPYLYLGKLELHGGFRKNIATLIHLLIMLNICVTNIQGKSYYAVYIKSCLQMSDAYSLWNTSDFIMCNSTELSVLGLMYVSVYSHKWICEGTTVFLLKRSVLSSSIQERLSARFSLCLLHLRWSCINDSYNRIIQ